MSVSSLLLKFKGREDAKTLLAYARLLPDSGGLVAGGGRRCALGSRAPVNILSSSSSLPLPISTDPNVNMAANAK